MGRFQNKRKMLKGPPRGISGDYQEALGQAAGGRPQLAQKPARAAGGGFTLSPKPAAGKAGGSPSRNIVSQKLAKVPGAMGSIGAAKVGDSGAAGGGSDPTSWIEENMPNWMRERDLTPEQALGFIRKNPDSPLAKMFQESMPSAMGSIGGTRATPPDRDPEITTLPARDGGPTRATPPARVPEVTTLPKPGGGPELVKRPAPAPEPTMTTLPAPDGGPSAGAPVMRPMPRPMPVPLGRPGGGAPPPPAMTTQPVGPRRSLGPPDQGGGPFREGGGSPMTTQPVGPPEALGPPPGGGAAPGVPLDARDPRSELPPGALGPPGIGPQPQLPPGLQGSPSFRQVNPVAIQSILQRIMGGQGQGGGRPIAEALGGLRA